MSDTFNNLVEEIHRDVQKHNDLVSPEHICYVLRALDQTIIGRAIREADDSLGSLRRCYGTDVSTLCYPAANTVGQAVRMLAEAGEIE